MSEAFFRAIESEAQRLRKRFGLSYSGPIDPLDLARSLGIVVLTPDEIPELPPSVVQTLLSAPATVWSGFSFPCDGTLVIIHNPTQTIERLRATIMEEIVHHVLDHLLSVVSTAPHRPRIRDYNRVKEKEARAIAAAILLPRKDILDTIRERLTVEEIATHYGVSADLVRFRLQTLRLKERLRWSLELRRVFSSSPAPTGPPKSGETDHQTNYC